MDNVKSYPVSEQQQRTNALVKQILPSKSCQHESVVTPDGHGAYCKWCAETLA